MVFKRKQREPSYDAEALPSIVLMGIRPRPAETENASFKTNSNYHSTFGNLKAALKRIKLL